MEPRASVTQNQKIRTVVPALAGVEIREDIARVAADASITVWVLFSACTN